MNDKNLAFTFASSEVNILGQNFIKLIEIFMLILPSINSLIFFITFSFNYILAKILVSKFDINQNQIINYLIFVNLILVIMSRLRGNIKYEN